MYICICVWVFVWLCILLVYEYTYIVPCIHNSRTICCLCLSHIFLSHFFLSFSLVLRFVGCMCVCVLLLLPLLLLFLLFFFISLSLFILFIRLPQTYTCFVFCWVAAVFVSFVSSHSERYSPRRKSPVETIFDTIFTNITVLSSVSTISILMFSFSL